MSCQRSFDLADRKLVGQTEIYQIRPKTEWWEVRFTGHFGIQNEGYKYNRYDYRDASIFTFEATTGQPRQSKILFLKPTGEVFELHTGDLVIEENMVQFQSKHFKRTNGGEAGRPVY